MLQKEVTFQYFLHKTTVMLNAIDFDALPVFDVNNFCVQLLLPFLVKTIWLPDS